MIEVDLVEYVAKPTETKTQATKLVFIPRVGEWLFVEGDEDYLSRGYYEVIGVSYFEAAAKVSPTIYLKSLGDDFDAETILRNKHKLKTYVVGAL